MGYPVFRLAAALFRREQLPNDTIGILNIWNTLSDPGGNGTFEVTE
jgi:hypothetical protein